MKNKKQSIIVGGLISSAGIFISKILGLLYVIPLNAIAGDTNMQYYGFAYLIYSYLLSVSTAGIPFAIATLVAKYSNIGDYKTTLLTKKLSTGVMLVLGFVGMSFLMIFAMPLAKMTMGANTSVESLTITRNVIVLISFALFFVPLLSAYRGFYQGFKELEVYAFSQVLEQIIRIAFLLGMGAIAVYVFNQDRIWAVYFAVLSTGVSALAAFVHIFLYDKRYIKDIKEKAAAQEAPTNSDSKAVFSELIQIAIPYLLVAIIGYSNNLIDLTLFVKAFEATGVAAGKANYIFGSMINVHVLKVVAIPQILAAGFSASIIPYVTVSYAQKKWGDLRKHIYDCVDSVLFIAVPLAFCLFFFSKDIMYTLFGNPTFTYETVENMMTIGHFESQLSYETVLLKWYSFDALLGTIAPVFTSLMMTVGLRKRNLINLSIGAVIKLIIEIPCIYIFGMNGGAVSNCLSILTIVLLDAYYLKKCYHVKWQLPLRRLALMMVCIAVMGVYAVAINHFIEPAAYGRFMTLILLGVKGVFAVLIYLLASSLMQLPQTIFKVDLKHLVMRIIGKVRGTHAS